MTAKAITEHHKRPIMVGDREKQKTAMSFDRRPLSDCSLELHRLERDISVFLWREAGENL